MVSTEPDIKHMQHIYDNADCIMDGEQVAQVIVDIAEAINSKLSEENVHLLALMNGGLVFSGQLMPHLQFPMTQGYIHATRYRNELHGSGIEWRVSADEQIQGRHVLLVDEIYDEGATLVEVSERLLAQGAAKVTTAVLLDKIHDRKLYPDFKPDFVGATIPDRYVFGFGLDYKGYWRNAPGIFAVNTQS